jgi:sulfonate transport system ATP-binding protein
VNPKLEVAGISKVFTTRRRTTEALAEVSFQAQAAEFVCVLGPSGCGKSTLLNIIAGLERPSQGEVRMDGVPVVAPGRDRVVIFQEAALFPWLNVRANVEFGLRQLRLSRRERMQRVEKYLELVGLHGFERVFIHEISGGMKQRVALARALALNPQVLLMDEPFAALDAQSRDRLHAELQSLWAQTGTTILFVTHNVREALVLGTRVLLMSARPGRIKHEYPVRIPRPRHIEDHDLVDAAREVLADLREEVLRAEEEEGHARLAR